MSNLGDCWRGRLYYAAFGARGHGVSMLRHGEMASIPGGSHNAHMDYPSVSEREDRGVSRKDRLSMRGSGIGISWAFSFSFYHRARRLPPRRPTGFACGNFLERAGTSRRAGFGRLSGEKVGLRLKGKEHNISGRGAATSAQVPGEIRLQLRDRLGAGSKPRGRHAKRKSGCLLPTARNWLMWNHSREKQYVQTIHGTRFRV